MDGISNYTTESENESDQNINVLIIDDEEGICLLLEDIVRECGYAVKYFLDPRQALTCLKSEDFSVVISDIRMPGMNGMELLDEIMLVDKNISVIMITAYGTIENAVLCMERGAFNYVTKPFKSDEIMAVIKKAVERVSLIRENILLKKKLQTITPGFTMIGNSKRMTETMQLAHKIAQTNFKVLITGESGTGKDLIARYIHNNSNRRTQPFIPLQCSLLPESLLESELFGYKKGAFTGALQDKKGLLEEADHGTVFLDEIGDINPNTQGKLLRFLQEKEIKRIGDTKSRIIDVRILFATNKNLHKLVNENLFREDLYFRIKEVEIRMPPLRERKEDIPLLTYHFLKEIAVEMNARIEIENNVIEWFQSCEWKGNIREFRNVLVNAAAICDNNLITQREISRIALYNEESNPTPDLPDADASFSDLRKKVLSDFDKKHIITCLANNKGNITRTAADLKIDKKNFWMMLKKYNIDHNAYK